MIPFSIQFLHSDPIPLFTSPQQENSSIFLCPSLTPTQILPSFKFSSKPTLLHEVCNKNLS